MDIQDELGDPIGTGIPPLPRSTTAIAPEYKMPVEIRITQVSGGYLINKFGHPLEVCTTLDEVEIEVGAYFNPAPPAGTLVDPQAIVQTAEEPATPAVS